MRLRSALSRFGAALALAAGLCLPAAEGLAQSAVCQQIAAELAGLGGGDGGAGFARQAAEGRARLGRIQSSMASLGCGRGFVLFGPQPPAECGGLRAQASALQSSIAQLDAAARQGGDGGARRMRLMASYDANNCRAPAGPRQRMVVAPQGEPPGDAGSGFLDALFGRGANTPRYATPEDMGAPPPEDGAPQVDAERKPRYGGGVPICVRTCDGFFFPVNYRGAEDQHADVCRASCPGAETRVYWMSAGADLDTAVTPEGSRYVALPAAYAYRKSFDAACTCKKPQQSWGSVLQQAEALIREKGTITVTEESSLQMSRPSAAGKGLRGVREPDAPAESPRPPVARQTPGFDAAAGAAPGQAGGEGRDVRVVAPNRGAPRPPAQPLPPLPAPPPLR